MENGLSDSGALVIFLGRVIRQFSGPFPTNFVASAISFHEKFRGGGGGVDSHMEQTGMLVGNFKFNP